MTRRLKERIINIIVGTSVATIMLGFVTIAGILAEYFANL